RAAAESPDIEAVELALGDRRVGVTGDAPLVVGLEEESPEETGEARVAPAADREREEVRVVGAPELGEPGAQVNPAFEPVALELVEHVVAGPRVEVFELESHVSPL